MSDYHVDIQGEWPDVIRATRVTVMGCETRRYVQLREAEREVTYRGAGVGECKCGACGVEVGAFDARCRACGAVFSGTRTRRAT